MVQIKKIIFYGFFVYLMSTCRLLEGACIDSISTVITPQPAAEGTNVTIQCQVNPKMELCGHLIFLYGREFFCHFSCPAGSNFTKCVYYAPDRYSRFCDGSKGLYGVRITNLQLNDAADWSCSYRTAFYDLEDIKTLTVIMPPTGSVITSSLGSIVEGETSVDEDKQLTVSCDASKGGVSGLTYSWIRPQGAGGVVQNNDQTSTLSFNQVKMKDVGFYTCVASNIAGTVTGQIRINILCPTASSIGRTAPYISRTAPPIGRTAPPIGLLAGILFLSIIIIVVLVVIIIIQYRKLKRFAGQMPQAS